MTESTNFIFHFRCCLNCEMRIRVYKVVVSLSKYLLLKTKDTGYFSSYWVLWTTKFLIDRKKYKATIVLCNTVIHRNRKTYTEKEKINNKDRWRHGEKEIHIQTYSQTERQTKTDRQIFLKSFVFFICIRPEPSSLRKEGKKNGPFHSILLTRVSNTIQ